jgi:pimeloyl-ACP methyl ester carboxylesterase
VRTITEQLSSTTVNGRRLACVTHDAGSDATVIFCHGFRGEKIGPNRTFVTAARSLAFSGISSLRFDQYGSGDSEGEFIDSRFDDWVDAIRTIAQGELARGRRVALFGQSMGGSAVICAAAEVDVQAVVAWVPDANTDAFVPGADGYFEEGGQRVGNEFWVQAHSADVPGRLGAVTAPCYLVFGTNDEYVSVDNREALIAACKPDDRVDVFDGYPHSAWTFDQAADIIERSTVFLERQLRA